MSRGEGDRGPRAYSRGGWPRGQNATSEQMPPPSTPATGAPDRSDLESLRAALSSLIWPPLPPRARPSCVASAHMLTVGQILGDVDITDASVLAALDERSALVQSMLDAGPGELADALDAGPGDLECALDSAASDLADHLDASAWALAEGLDRGPSDLADHLDASADDLADALDRDMSWLDLECDLEGDWP
jgi:AcrR family transcriptional regulator